MYYLTNLQHKNGFCVALILFLFLTNYKLVADVPGSAITQQDWRGRFGDQLTLYAKAKWFSLKYGILFLCKPFVHSENLMLHYLDHDYQRGDEKRFKKAVLLEDINQAGFHIEDNTLYIMGYYTKMPEHWCADVYINQLRQLVRLREPDVYKVPDFPIGVVTVAMHVRKGGGYDKPLLSRGNTYTYADLAWPLKFPPDSYYVEQIKKLYELFNKRSLYVYIFTDDKQPWLIAKKYAEAVNASNITWNYRQENSNFVSNTIEDFFNMQHFDCLIRPDSNFSIWAEMLGDFKVAISPLHSTWLESDHLEIDQVMIKDKSDRRIY